MSASREKKVRQERGSNFVSAKDLKAREEQKANRRTTAIFTVCAVLFVAAVVAMFLWNSGVFQRKAAAASVNGQNYSVSDVAYYYYNSRANALNSNSDLDSNTSMRDQEYTASDEFATWYDYLADQSVRYLATTQLIANAAKAAGFNGGSEVDESVKETMDSLKTAAADQGYDVSNYVKAIFNGLVTRGEFEKSLRTAALSEAYTNYKADATNYSDDELTAVYNEDPTAYSMVTYESLVFGNSNYATEAVEATETTPAVEADDGSAAAKSAAEDALARYKAGEKLDALGDELGASYSSTTALYGTGSDLADWLFDDARKDGDTAVLDYSYYGYSMGSMVVVFHSSERADFHAVNVRHILVEDEATANDVLAQYLAGEQTEDAFAALAQEHSTDNADDGGLYENVYIGQMVKPFEDWCFDAARQTGDTGIVQTDYGYHVMYFVSANDAAYWQQLAATKLVNDWSESLTESIDTQLLDGMKYIDR
ncbi:MAG: peptidylprolyl isomerase [Oscillospiraceae bacterium]|nr:peptidylprolyl isomerase [Oscillospiraceae bacterium]